MSFKKQSDIFESATNMRNIRDNCPLYEGIYKYGKEMNWVKGVREPILNKGIL